MLTKSSARDKNDFAQNASKRHKMVGEVLAQGYFKNYRTFQEVPIADINANYQNRQVKADWYIPDLHVVIEVHGEQHYKPIDFGGEGLHKAKLRFVRGQHLDVEKVMALAEVGISVVEIAPDDPINEDVLIQLISDTLKKTTAQSTSCFKRPRNKQDKANKQNRLRRKQYYREMKQKFQKERD